MSDDLATTARERARELFLDDANTYGCAETAFVVLKEAFELPAAADSAAAMALNGGIAYSGSTCGAITGAISASGSPATSRSSRGSFWRNTLASAAFAYALIV